MGPNVVKERSCDNMVDAGNPYCYSNLGFPHNCLDCLTYQPDAQHWDTYREKIWRELVLDRSNASVGYEIPESARYKQDKNQ